MKNSPLVVISAAFLLVAAGVGYGFKQTEGNLSDRPVLSFEDQEISLAAGTHGEIIRLASDRQEFVPEGNWAGTDWQDREAVETGAVPVMVSEEPWMREYGND